MGIVGRTLKGRVRSGGSLTGHRGRPLEPPQHTMCGFTRVLTVTTVMEGRACRRSPIPRERQPPILGLARSQDVSALWVLCRHPNLWLLSRETKASQARVALRYVWGCSAPSVGQSTHLATVARHHIRG